MTMARDEHLLDTVAALEAALVEVDAELTRS
jgi:hypothetical protein